MLSHVIVIIIINTTIIVVVIAGAATTTTTANTTVISGLQTATFSPQLLTLRLKQQMQLMCGL